LSCRATVTAHASDSAETLCALQIFVLYCIV